MSSLSRKKFATPRLLSPGSPGGSDSASPEVRPALDLGPAADGTYQHRDHDLQVADDAVVGHARRSGPSRSLLMAMILADSSMPARCWTAPLMPQAMYRARADGGAGLADLVLLADEAAVHGRAAGADRPAEAAGQSWISLKLSLLPTPPPPATITRAAFRFTLRGSRCRSISLQRPASKSLSSTFSSMTWPVRSASRLVHAHHAFAHGGHLRPAVVVDDRGDDVAAEGRADLQQQVLVDFLGLGGRCSRRSAGRCSRRSARTSGRSATRGARSRPSASRRNHDLRLVLADQLADARGRRASVW